MKKIFILCIVVFSALCSYSQKEQDTENLGKALEYFASGKYHEALLIFTKLDKQYKLNPRFHAYIGMCHYYEWQYEEAVKYLDKAIPLLENFSPHERSVYYYADAESHFILEKYKEAIPLYEKVITLCYENEKGDCFFRLGFCYMFLEEWINAKDRFESALVYYRKYRNCVDMNARMEQLEKMIKGCGKQIEEMEKKKDNDASRNQHVGTDRVSVRNTHKHLQRTQHPQYPRMSATFTNRDADAGVQDDTCKPLEYPLK